MYYTQKSVQIVCHITGTKVYNKTHRVDRKVVKVFFVFHTRHFVIFFSFLIMIVYKFCSTLATEHGHEPSPRAFPTTSVLHPFFPSLAGAQPQQKLDNQSCASNFSARSSSDHLEVASSRSVEVRAVCALEGAKVACGVRGLTTADFDPILAFGYPFLAPPTLDA